MSKVDSVTQETLLSQDVQDHIAKFVQEQSMRNYTMDVSEGSILGDNYLGVIAKVDVHGEDEHNKKKTLNLIVKSALTPDFMSSSSLRTLYEREIFAYSTIFPAFVKFQIQKIEHPFNSWPKFHTSLLDETNEAIVLENMKVLGYKLLDCRNPYDYNHCLLAVREYGRFHAVSYAIRDQQTELFQKLTENLEDRYITETMCGDMVSSFFRKSNHKVFGCLDTVDDKVACEKFYHFLDTAIQSIKKLVSSEAADEYAVIVHGDGWINNLLYKYEDEEEPLRPTKMCILDWQTVFLGSPIFDLSFLIFSSTDKKLRDQHYDDLLLEYYHSLSSHLVILGSDPTKLFPFEVFQEHLKKFSVFGLYLSIATVMASLGEVEDTSGREDSNFVDDVVDTYLGSDDSICKYHERLRGIILDFVRLNYV